MEALVHHDLDALVKDERIIRHWKKIKAIRTNAQYIVDLAAEHGSAATYFAKYPATDYVGLLGDIRKRASFLGGTTGQYFLREMGKESFILSRDVVAALRREIAGLFPGLVPALLDAVRVVGLVHPEYRLSFSGHDRPGRGL